MDTESKTVKRSSEKDIGEEIKRRKIEYVEEVNEIVSENYISETEDTTQGDEDIFKLDTLPDDVLLVLLSFLNTSDLLQISRCNRRMYNICTAKTLWTKEIEYVEEVNEIVSENYISETEDTTQGDEAIFKLDTLPDDVLLVLLSFLNTSDLLQISRCNRRMYNICTTKTLWTKVDAVCDGRSPAHICIPSNLHSGTVSMKFQKKAVEDEPENGIDTCFGNDFFTKLDTLTGLKILHVVNHNLNREMLDLSYLPASITELRLTRTKITDVSKFLTKIEDILPNLEVIDLSYCQWFDPQFLIPLAKCRNLKVLLLVGCRNLKNIIPYASIAATYGYRQLETLDMRLTGVVDREIACFNKIKSLKHIYLERPEDVEDSDESITDICTTSLGMRNWRDEELNDPNANRVLICRIPPDGGNFSDHVLETLVVRNYPRITDITLKHAEKCLRSLKYLDLYGSSCSAEQVAIFRMKRPEVCLTL